MIDLSRYKGKNIGVVGLGKTGLSAVKALQSQGANISVWDDDEAKRNNAGADILDLSKPVDFLLWSPGIAHYGPDAHKLATEAKAKNITLVCDIELFVGSVSNDILAVTGTNGKSTTTALIQHTLSQFRPCLMGGNIGAPVLDLETLPADGVYVLELSSYQLELAPSLKSKGAVLLNITPDHLARHGNMATYSKAKANIFSKGNNGVAVISIDTEPAKEIARALKGGWKIIPVSTQNNIGVYADNGILYDGGKEILDFSGIPSLKGKHNHENAAAAYALIKNVYDYPSVDIVKAMSSFEGLPHRQYLVRRINNVAYINDSKATNAEAAAKALVCMDNIYWIIGGQAKDGGLNGLEIYKDRVVHSFLIGEAADNFAAWLQKQGMPYTKCGTLEIAVQKAHEMAQRDKKPATVLLSPACASWDQFQSFEHRGNIFAQLVENLTV